jgi:hypothetical protein
MSIVVRPATKARFGDVATMLGPKNPASSVCWCLSHRLDSKTNRALTGRARGEYVKMLHGTNIRRPDTKRSSYTGGATESQEAAWS